MTTGGFRSGLVAKLKETRTKFLMWLLLPREVRAALAEAKGGRSNPLSAKLVTDAFIKMAGKLPPPTERQLAKMNPTDRGRFENMRRMAHATEAAGLDRTPTKQRNGRDAVTDALDGETLRSAPVALLVDRFLDLAVVMHWCSDAGRVTRYNRLYKRLHAIEEALKARAPDGRSALLPYLTDRNPGIRRFAASSCRELAPAAAAAALKTLNYDTAGGFGASIQADLEIPAMIAQWEEEKRQKDAQLGI